MMASCTLARPSIAFLFEGSASPDQSHTLAEFPLSKGTIWVYSYTEYEPTTTNPTQITKAAYLFTETILGTQSVPSYFIAHVQHEERLVKADPDWIYTESSRPKEFWYVVRGQQVYESALPLDLTNIQTDTLLLAFDFPLVLGKSWCPSIYVKGEKIQDCTASGRRTVANQESYQTPAGDFKQCYKLTEDFNSGGVTRWLCNGIGVVAEKYDHAGTRFGFQETLASFSRGSP
jgi:hypothetical protein